MMESSGPRSGDEEAPEPARGTAEKAGRIARGHAFAAHAKEFGDLTQLEFETLVKQTMDKPDVKISLLRSRFAYWNSKIRMIVIEDPASVNGGTAFSLRDGAAYLKALK